MKYFNVELLNAELNRLANNGLIPDKLKGYLLQFLKEYELDEKTLGEAFSAQPLPPTNDSLEYSQNFPQ